jgi:hypothetical protein
VKRGGREHHNVAMRSLSGRPDGPDQFEQQGWPGQLARVERWHARAIRLLDPACRASEEDIVDFLYAFFQSAYHLRDWIVKGGSASNAELKKLFADNRCLELCSDVCNASKHLVLDSRHATARIGLMREYVPPLPGDSASGTRPTLLAFQDRDGYVEFVPIGELLNDCMTVWRDFCSAR